MVFFRTLRSHNLCSFLQRQITPITVSNQQCSSSLASSSSELMKCGSFSNSFSVIMSSILQRSFSASPQIEEQSKTDSDKDEPVKDYKKTRKKTKCMKRYEKIVREKKQKKPLDVMFKAAVGLIEKIEESSESSGEELERVLFGDSKLKEIKELKKKLRKLESEVKTLKANGAKKDEIPKVQAAPPKSLYALFTGKPVASKREGVKSSGLSESLNQGTLLIVEPGTTPF